MEDNGGYNLTGKCVDMFGQPRATYSKRDMFGTFEEIEVTGLGKARLGKYVFSFEGVRPFNPGDLNIPEPNTVDVTYKRDGVTLFSATRAIFPDIPTEMK